MSELSASALQIREKKERMTAMYSLAKVETYGQIVLIKSENNITEKQLLTKLMKKGIPILPFIQTYIEKSYSVSENIAKSYFKTYAECLEPKFVTFNPHGKAKHTYFHLTESTIKELIKESNTKTESEKP